MARTNRLLLLGALMALVAVPLAAQGYSEGYTFLKAVRERDGNIAENILSNPSSTAVNVRDPSTGESATHILVRGRDLTLRMTHDHRRLDPERTPGFSQRDHHREQRGLDNVGPVK